MDKEALIKSIKQAIKDDFKTNTNVLEVGAISLTDALNGITSDKDTLKEVVNILNNDKRFRFFAFYDEQQSDVIRYEYYEDKKESLVKSSKLVEELNDIIAKIHELESNNNLAYVLQTSEGYIIESVDDSYSYNVELY